MMDAAFWFGQRLHPSVYAAVQNIPFIGMEYQFDKMLDWASTVDVDNVVHTETASLESFIEVHERVAENMMWLRKNLPKLADRIRLTAKSIVELV